MNEELRKIWWIASFPKSGNTLVRFFLNAYVTKFPLDINAHYQYACIDQQSQLYQQVAAKAVDDCHPTEILYLRPSMLMHYIQAIAPRDACFKTHTANLNVDGIPLIPQRLTKQAVYLVRDPRDIAISYAKHCKMSINLSIDLMADNSHIGQRGNKKTIHDVITSWSSHVDSWMQHAKFPVELIHFEDMISQPDAAFRRILPALGFREIDEEAFQFALGQTTFENLQRLEGKTGFREAKHDTTFFNVGKSNYWKDVLTSEQVQRIEDNHRESMAFCGYELCHGRKQPAKSN